MTHIFEKLLVSGRFWMQFWGGGGVGGRGGHLRLKGLKNTRINAGLYSLYSPPLLTLTFRLY